MSKKLELIGSSNVKLSDTNTSFKFNVTEDNSAVNLDDKNIIFKVKNNEVYIEDIPASVNGTNVILNSRDLNLPPDTYYLELWIKGPEGTSIFPDNNFVTLKINQNATGITGDVISTVTLDAFTKKIDDALANLHDGEQGPIGLTGPTGPIGPQGEPGFKKIYFSEQGVDSSGQFDGTSLLTDMTLSIGDIVLDIKVDNDTILSQDVTKSAKVGDTVVLFVGAQSDGQNSLTVIANMTGHDGQGTGNNSNSNSGLKVAISDMIFAENNIQITDLKNVAAYTAVLDIGVQDPSLIAFTQLVTAQLGDTVLLIYFPGSGWIPVANLTPHLSSQKLADVLVKKGILTNDDLIDENHSTLKSMF